MSRNKLVISVVAILCHFVSGQKRSFLTQDNIIRHCVGENYHTNKVEPAMKQCDMRKDIQTGDRRRLCILQKLKWDRRGRMLNDLSKMDIGNSINNATECFKGKTRLRNTTEILNTSKCVARKFAVACTNKVNKILAMKSGGNNNLKAWRNGWKSADVVPDELDKIPEMAAYVSFPSGTDVLPGKLISTADVSS